MPETAASLLKIYSSVLVHWHFSSTCFHLLLLRHIKSFNKLLLQKEELEQKHVHLLQVVESEKTAKWQYTQQCEELASEIRKLRAEVNWIIYSRLVSVELKIENYFQICVLRKETSRSSFSATPVGRGSFSAAATATVAPNEPHSENSAISEAANLSGLCESVEDSLELRKIKKVQSFFRGWLCRRRWKQIVEEYIKSPHAESMRKRNSLVFSMVEAEEEYLEQLEVNKKPFSVV